MNTKASLFKCFLVCLNPLAAQDHEPVVSKETLSVHRVERGNMPLFGSARGTLTSLRPPKALVTFSTASPGPCEAGRSARIQIGGARALGGRVVRALTEGCEVELSEPLPDGSAAGDRIEALVAVGEIKDAVFFDRPADAAANSSATVFVLEPDSSFARRVAVRYGSMSGPVIQVLEGLVPGDRVIVTNTSRWVRYPRIRIQ